MRFRPISLAADRAHLDDEVELGLGLHLIARERVAELDHGRVSIFVVEGHVQGDAWFKVLV